ncbi:hypothetical protein A7D27_17620 [Pseudomonas sp. 1D4]|uniref:hypothetical protein n=1 Tax=Pseudomonadaceae TaxID=135621 RepID=UPI00084ACBF1|nr:MULTISPECIES: hypothetical protein [Pseudomonas]OEC39771.1 hypothetical protein A7D27_17620 [Pseudomonas sp. 1D4]OEC53344.1 hypothetical protein A9G05_20920 [Pseudomonas sp. ENNP23]
MGLFSVDPTRSRDVTASARLVSRGQAAATSDPAPAPTARTLRQNTPAPDTRAAQRDAAYDEAFARLKVDLQNNGERVRDEVYPDAERAAASVEKPVASKASQEFHAYMEKTDSEKIRDKILKQMGLTEEDLEKMPPEKREQVEKMIAQRMTELNALQQQQQKEEKEPGSIPLSFQDIRLRNLING